MYECPITIFEQMSDMIDEINNQKEEMIYKAIVNVGVNVDKEELLKALQYDRNQYEKGRKDMQEFVEQRCRELGIDYVSIFTCEKGGE